MNLKTIAWVGLLGCAAAAGCTRQSQVQTGDLQGVLHRGVGPEIADLDPELATQASCYSVDSALYEGLVAEDPADLHPVPGAARSWDIAEDGVTYTFHLRADARWSDGQAVTAQDFVDSWHRILTPSLGSTDASELFLIQGAEAFYREGGDFSQVGVAATDARTLRVVLEHPAPWFLSLLSEPAWMPVPVRTIAKYGPPNERSTAWAVPGRWVGNGPFVLSSWRSGDEIVVTKSPTYWDAAQVRLSQIHFHFFDSEDAEERSFRAGQLHVTEAVPPARIDAYRALAPSPLRSDPLLGTFFIRINVRRRSLDDPRVRRALALAIDREALATRILRGGQAPANAFTPEGLQGYKPGPSQGLNADEARRLLQDSGHPGGDALPEFELIYASAGNNAEVAQVLQEEWKRELGVRVHLSAGEVKGVEEARATGNYDLLGSSWIGDYADPSAFLDLLKTDSGNNFTGWSNRTYDSLLFSAERTPQTASRLALYSQAEQLMLAEAPVIPIYHYAHVFLIQPSVHGWLPTLLDHHPYKAVWLSAP